MSDLAVFSGASILAFSGFSRRVDARVNGSSPGNLSAYGYGGLISKAATNTGETLLALPNGFEYTVIGKRQSPMADGRMTPPLHDGMAAFKVGREHRLVRNHEVLRGKVPNPGAGIGAHDHYDETAPGGTTTLIVDPKTREIVRDFVSLSGTLINCAGGPTPWGSWVSCEETTLGKAIRTSSKGVKTGGFPKPHGYCFEVSAAANSTVPPLPLKAMGRFVHEAIAVDRKSGILYLTEDVDTAGFYRFIPKRKKHLADGGTLQMLRVTDRPNYDTRTGQGTGIALQASWVTIANPDPEEADVDELAIYKQGHALGASTFARLEGCYADKKGRIFFSSSDGGDKKGGQIWRYDPDGRDNGTLTMLFESPDRQILDMPDNICLMPMSDLLFLCEDGDYVGLEGTPDNYIRILTPSGRIADFAKNISAEFPNSEFAGSTFSPDGKTLFVNLQQVGATCAIWGDWKRFRA